MEFQKILVPVIGTEADEETIKLACRLAKRYKSKVLSIYVIKIKRALPIDAEIESEIQKAEGVLDFAEGVAEEQDYEIETDVIQARDAGPAIIDEAVERDSNLILMGIKYKTRFGQFNLGHVVPYVLQNAPCPVILYQQ